MNSSHLLVVVLIVALFSMLTSMYYFGRKRISRQIFVISVTIYLATIGVFVLRLLGEKDPFVVSFLLLVSLSAFLLFFKFTYKS